MNIIEQYGSYENAKNAFETSKKAKDFFQADIINHALKEYRREHNIFEVGDKIIHLDVDNIFIYTVQKVTLDLITVVRKKKSNAVKTRGMWLGNNELRHATPEEVEAGRRL